MNLSKTEQSFNLSNDLKIEVKRFKGDAKKYYCNDVPSEAGDIISTWTAYQGTVKLQIVQDSIAFNSQGKPEYKINVTIENIEFKNNNDKKFSVDLLEFKEVYVGWLPG